MNSIHNYFQTSQFYPQIPQIYPKILIKIESFIILAVLMPKRVTSFRGPSLHHCALATQLHLRNIAAVASRWQLCVRFKRPEI